MSVILFQPRAFGEIASTILADQRLKEEFPSIKERRLLEAFGKDYEKTLENFIKCWAERLYIANQLAYYYQYPDETDGKTIVIKRMEEKDFKQAPLTLREFESLLSQIEYNLYTNNGRIFLGEEDQERIERLTTLALRLIVYGIE